MMSDFEPLKKRRRMEIESIESLTSPVFSISSSSESCHSMESVEELKIALCVSQTDNEKLRHDLQESVAKMEGITPTTTAHAVLLDTTSGLSGLFARCKIVSFLHSDDMAALYETCKTFKNTMKYLDIKPTVPSSLHIVQTVSMLLWAVERGYRIVKFSPQERTLHPQMFAKDLTLVKATNMHEFGTLSTAALVGSMSVMKFLITSMNTDRKESGSNLCTFAALGGHFTLLKWLRTVTCAWDSDTFHAAAAFGDLQVLKWLHTMRCPWDARTFTATARQGNLEALDWLRSNGCPWDVSTAYAAASCGHWDVLKWLRLNGCPSDTSTCDAVAQKGNLDILAWCRVNGCPWEASTCAAASQGMQWEVLKWLRGHGCPWDFKTSQRVAESGSIAILAWCRDNSCPANESACEGAAVAGHWPAFKWLRAHGYPWSPSTRALWLTKVGLDNVNLDDLPDTLR